MKVMLLLMLSILSFQASAQERYVCKDGTAERTVEVVYSQPGHKVPCDVKYTKASGSQVLWSASHEIGYCETKAQTFATKLGTLGWTCSKAEKTVAEQPLSE
ncbi:hypothetical protein VXS05_09105 [Photobacterium toruni]|uniref:Uncharacterized protein n=1 Tax=Photobacterium toruni TaxID=1935446 RepID=A0ABU6L311_9GAMM|nr:hypothetical protein [Photobacterium toruni]MEC6830922.1 hypothetical protein [Photobacterium toruni]